MNPFQYPEQPHRRRHGPRGYARYESYRDWLRDEFSFRCVYCLDREQWVNAKGSFAVDHFVPMGIEPTLASEYDNLLYACLACNLTRGSQSIPNPLDHLLASTVNVNADGRMAARTAAAGEIVETLHLNDPKYIVRRQRMIALLRELEIVRTDLYRIWLGYPDDLPNLAQRRPPGGNTRPQGIDQTFFALRQRGELSGIY